jgi:hypothetical protein
MVGVIRPKRSLGCDLADDRTATSASRRISADRFMTRATAFGVRSWDRTSDRCRDPVDALSLFDGILDAGSYYGP